jgi:hypothetical protein
MAGRSYAPPQLDDWRVQRYLEWLCTIPADREPKTQNEFSQLIGISVHMLMFWKDDPDFLAAWEHRYQKTIGSVLRRQEVMQRLYETAVDRTDPRQVVAAKAYLDAIGQSKPQRPPTTPKDAKGLSDEQLYAILADRMASGVSDGG